MRELQLQGALADLIFAAEADPNGGSGFAAARGLDPADAETFARQSDRFALYRTLARNNLVAPLENTFPISQALLGEADWDRATTAFLAARSIDGPYYRDIAPAFVAWLHRSGWGRDRWPALLELAHYEWMELQVCRCPEAPRPTALQPAPTAEARMVLDPAVQILAYRHAVHRASIESPEPAAEPCQLLLYRDADGDFQVLELTESTAALLVRAQAGAWSTAVAALGPEHADELPTLLADLDSRGILLGFHA